jgi:enoyl-CoA hydratase/carnithine racemase
MRSEGVVEVCLHSDDGPLVWGGRAGYELTTFFDALSIDEDVKVLILTGTGEAFCDQSVSFDFRKMRFRDAWAGEQRMLGRLLDLNAIVIAAVNGPVHYHPEIPLLADIVLAAPEAEFAELGHFARGMAPGDGAQLVIADLIGPTRTSYFYLTEQRLSAAECQRLGVVHEIHSRETLLARARELAADLARRPAATLSYSKAVLRLRDRRNFHEDLSHGMALEGLALYATDMSGPE